MAYLLAKRWMLILACYLILATVLRLNSIADIFPPCIISKVVGRPCPGCGLTRAGLSLLKLDFRSAWSYNPTIFLFVPAAVGLVITDVRAFYRRRCRLPGSEADV